METVNPCNYHQFGYCRFGVTCRKFHTPNTFLKSNNEKVSCLSRRPQPSTLSDIVTVSLEQIVHKLDKYILKMKETLEKVLSTLAQKEIEVKGLEEKALKLEEKSTITEDENNTCGKCQYQASSAT